MAVGTFDAQRLESNGRTAAWQSLRLVAGRAGQLCVTGIQTESRVPLMVKHKLPKALAFDVALRTTDLLGRAELTDVRITMARLALATGRPAKDSAEVVRLLRGYMAFCAIGLGMRAAQREASPTRVVERLARHVSEALCGVTACTTSRVAYDSLHVRTIEGAAVCVIMTGPAIVRCVVKGGQHNVSILGRGEKLRIESRVTWPMTAIASNGDVGARKGKSRQAMLIERKSWAAKRMRTMTGSTILSAKRSLVEFSSVWIPVARSASTGRAAKDTHSL